MLSIQVCLSSEVLAPLLDGGLFATPILHAPQDAFSEKLEPVAEPWVESLEDLLDGFSRNCNDLASGLTYRRVLVNPFLQVPF